jgi:hypothetical protein
MAITVNTNFDNGKSKGRAHQEWGAHRVSIYFITGDTSYPTGGYSWDPKASGHQGAVGAVLLFPIVSGGSGATTAAGRVFQYDHTNKKIMAFQQKDPAAAGGADIQLPEVANATSLAGAKLIALVFSD